MRQILTAILAVALFSMAACGSGKTCQDAVNAANNCRSQLGAQPDPDDKAECDAANCADKQKVIDCIVALQCGNDLTTYQTALNNCATSGGCH